MRLPTVCEALSDVMLGMKLVISPIMACTKVSPGAGFSLAPAVS